MAKYNLFDCQTVVFTCELQDDIQIRCKCVIIDDTDLPKTRFKTEKIGKVFSHTQMKPILGFKAVFLCFTDGVSQSILDFSLHGKEGKCSDKPQGLSKKLAGARYSKERSEDERIAEIQKIRTYVNLRYMLRKISLS